MWCAYSPDPKLIEKTVASLIFLKHMLLAILFSSQYSLASDKLNIATDNWPPYEFYLNNDPNQPVTGFSTEIIQTIFRQLKVAHKKIAIYPWARAELLILKGKIDALYSVSSSEQRKQCCYFPDEPLINSPWIFFIRRQDQDRLFFRSFDDLTGYLVGAVRSYSYTPEFWQYLKTKGNYQLVGSDEQNFIKLLANRVDFVISEYGNGKSLIRKLQAQNKVIPLEDTPIKVTGLYIIFHKKRVSHNLVVQFSDQLKHFKQTAAYQSLYNKYFTN
ncbi:substrate-binding periplasmic protein [Spartinivicinus poritis]|uniref:Transporter substrate-binding domain-containing protein n=1 Tax=Spartinivicinus poritis TaxID=2994640 RepID=A0ABT5U958_9GAMM|nr:transporter substrate-binding domain-containing protein [Spartinivicinus sp. A2-2]MDE1462911.1 transporter substrate-binding domain-containing protein [Spartinivicinus sp. A2-2]